MRIFAIRPEPGLSSTIDTGAARGLEISGFPLSAIAPCGWTLPDLAGIDALLLGSANAVRHGGAKLAALRHLPVLAVGKATAQVAEQAGFSVAKEGSGGLQALLDQDDMPYHHLLRLSGEDHVPVKPPSAVELTTRVVYRVQETGISQEFEIALHGGGLVLLHSAGAAAHFAAECDRLGIDRGRISLAAIGPRVAEAAGPGWLIVRAAAKPSDAELLALAQDMCQ